MEKLIVGLSKTLHFLAIIILGSMAFLITFDVIGRKVFKSPIMGTVDLTQVGLSLIIFLSLAYTHLKNEHIAVELFVGKLSKKVQMIFDCLINVVMTIILSLMAWSLYGNAMRIYQSNTVTGDLSMPLYIFAMIAMIGTVVFALTAFLYVIQYARKVVKNES